MKAALHKIGLNMTLTRTYIFIIVLVMTCLCAAPLMAAEDVLELDGIIEPSAVVSIGSPVPGVLSEILVDRSAVVRKGDVLARLDSGLERIAVDLARTRLSVAEREMERKEALFQKEVISIHERDAAGDELKILALKEKEALEQLRMKTIRSPLNGVVMRLDDFPGAYVTEDSFITIACINPLNVEVVASVEYINIIQENMAAEIVPEPPVGGSYQAKVTLVDKVIDSASGTFGVRLVLANPGGSLQAGLKCKVRFFYK